ncbi:MAG: hypothetical protein ACRD1K_09750 [Acidimicrobiales bacterium]
MSPVRTDEPVRFFALEATAGRAARIKVWSTSPVVAVYPDDPADA